MHFLRLYCLYMNMRHTIFTLTAMLSLTGCFTSEKETMNTTTSRQFYVGTYTSGESEGIYKYTLTANGRFEALGLVATSNNPSYLARSADDKFLIAVNEIDQHESMGSVEAYLISDDSLKLMNRHASGGAHPCFVAINDDGVVLAANYTGGNVGLLKLSKEGRLSELLDVQQHLGKGSTERQLVPHAHSTWFRPNSSEIISVDLGTNELWFSSLDSETEKFIPADTPTLKMEDGAGPRHLTFHPNGKWIYVVNELNSTVALVQSDSSGHYVLGDAVSTLPAGFSEANTCADISISSDGKFVYASNRGHNSIAVFNVNPDDGSLTLIGNKGCGGEGPRNFTLSPDEAYILVANQHTNNIVSLKRSETTGLLKYVSQIEAPTPVCIVF